jgi:hypothetical protein
MYREQLGKERLDIELERLYSVLYIVQRAVESGQRSKVAVLSTENDVNEIFRGGMGGGGGHLLYIM